MSQMKHCLASLTLAVTAVASTQALAQTSGTIAATSEYMFRGISSSSGAAIQGSLTYNHETGFYAGGWASNVAPVTSDGNELDLYAGYSTSLSSGVNVDVGAIYYAYTEDEQATLGGADADYPELYAGASFGGISGKLFFTNDYLNSSNDAIYATLNYALVVKEGLDLTFQVGHSSGDGVKAVFGNEYLDYSVGLSKNVGDGMAANFALVNTDLKNVIINGKTIKEDEPKVVVSFSKSFDL